MGPQEQEDVGRVPEREHHPGRAERPERARQVAGRRRCAAGRLARGRLAHGAKREHREDGRNDRHGDDLPQRQPGGQQREGEERPDRGSGRVHEAVVAERRAGPVRIGGVAQKRVARGGADALADPVEHARAEHPAPGRGEGDERLCDVREGVPGPHERQAPVDPVRPPAHDVADDLRRRSGGPLDEADGRHGGVQRGHQKQRQDRVEELGRGVVHQARPAHCPHVAGDFPAALSGAPGPGRDHPGHAIHWRPSVPPCGRIRV